MLVLHGGPGLEYSHMDGLVDELAAGYRVATFQQRGLAPSTVEGPFTIEQAVDDIVALLDHLDIEHALLVGSSWGGHLGFHAAIAIPDRVRGLLAVDPLGAVGDGGFAEFGRAMLERLTPDARARADEIEAVEEAEGPSEETLRETWRLFWPCYFADPSAAPPVIPQAASVPAYLGLFAALIAERERLEAALPTVRIPVGIVAGSASPLPVSAARATTDRIPGAWIEVIEHTGHFPWMERPGVVRAALDRLVAG